MLFSHALNNKLILVEDGTPVRFFYCIILYHTRGYRSTIFLGIARVARVCGFSSGQIDVLKGWISFAFADLCVGVELPESRQRSGGLLLLSCYVSDGDLHAVVSSLVRYPSMYSSPQNSPNTPAVSSSMLWLKASIASFTNVSTGWEL